VTKFTWKRLIVLLAALVSVSCFASADPKTPMLLETLTIRSTQIAFVHGGDIWIVGKAAKRSSGASLSTLASCAAPFCPW
jgi:hypothetical protein